MNIREIEEAGLRHYEAKGIAAGEQSDGEQRCCLHCLEEYNALEEQCPCEPVETGVEDFDRYWDR